MMIFTYLECCGITVAKLLMYVDQQVTFPLVVIHNLTDVLGPTTALLGQGFASRLFKHHTEWTAVWRQLGQVGYGIKRPLRIVGHDVWQVTETDHYPGLRVQILVAPVDPLLQQRKHLFHRELLEVVDTITKIHFEDDVIQAP